MMKRSKSLYRSASGIMPGGVDSNFRLLEPFPFYVSRARGSKLYDIDGNECIDFLLSQGAILLGHQRREIKRAVKAQIDACANVALPTELAVEVAKTISSYVPSVRNLRFCNSGTEATMNAIRTARGFTGRDMIAKPEGGYHGVHDYTLWSLWGPPELTGKPSRPKAVPFSKGIPKAVAKTIVIFPFNDIEATYDILHRNRERLAAVISEPVMANAGCLLPEDDYVGELAKVCKELDILLILDEVITGFRLSRGGAQGMFGVKPDLTTFGKALGGGFQMAAFGGRKEVMGDLVKERKEWPHTTFHGGTYNAHPVSLAASSAVLKIIRDDRVYTKLQKNADMLFPALQDILDDLRIKAQVSSCGSMGHIYFGAEKVRTAREAVNTDWEKLGKWCLECLTHGMLFGHPKGEKMYLSTAHSREDITRAIEVAEQGFRAVRGR
jgi:glutamate-1-semialdehyde 2,1-aminomutase